MRRDRILFGIWLIGWVLVWVLGQSNVGLFILIGSLLAAAVEIALVFCTRKQLEVELSGNATAAKHETAEITVTVENRGWIDCARVEAVLQCHNLLTGEELTERLHTGVGRKSRAQLTLPFRWDRCGKVEITVEQLSALDGFGLSRFRLGSQTHVAVLVLPELMAVETLVDQQRQVDLSSEEYSMLHAGDDPSETFALREYRPGDRVRNIHWKLTEKMDEPMVRELGLPVNNALLVLLDNSDARADAALRELLGETVVSLSAALLQKQLSHDVAWIDSCRGQLSFCHVASDEDMNVAMVGVLSAEMCEDGPSALERLSESRELEQFAHVLVVTASHAVSAEVVGGARITWLRPTPEQKEGLYVEV